MEPERVDLPQVDRTTATDQSEMSEAVDVFEEPKRKRVGLKLRTGIKAGPFKRI